MQQRLKAAARAAGAEVVAAQPLKKLLLAVDDAPSALDARLGREALAALTRALERATPRHAAGPWRASRSLPGPAKGGDAVYHEVYPRFLLFFTGCVDLAVRQPDGAWVALVGRTHAEGRTFAVLDEWYGLLRAEFGWRYGRPGAAPPTR